MSLNVLSDLHFNVGALKAVSYTHLDVYKRQIEHYADIAQFVALANEQNLERLAAEVDRGSTSDASQETPPQ